MKVIGFSAGSVGREGNVDRIVKAVLQKSGHEVEFVKLADLSYSGCKGCVQLCARPQVCRLEDDAQPYYQKVKEADAVVIGTPIDLSRIININKPATRVYYNLQEIGRPDLVEVLEDFCQRHGLT